MLFVAALLAAVPSFGVGWIVGALHVDQTRQDLDIAVAKHILDEHPDRFSRLRINAGPALKFLIEGEVRTRDDYEQLRTMVIREFGEPRGKTLLAVDVLERDDSPSEKVSH